MFPHDMSSIRTTRFSSVRRRRHVMLTVAIAAGAVGILTFATRADEATKSPAPQPLVVVPGATINLLPDGQVTIPVPGREPGQRVGPRELRIVTAEGAKQDILVLPQSPQREFTGKLQLEPNARLPQPTIEPIPPWIIGDPAFQVIPNYEAGSAVAVFVAPKAPPAER